jgi:hypothetical protein
VFKNEGCRAITRQPYITELDPILYIGSYRTHATSSSPYRITAYYGDIRFRGSIELDR